MFDIADRSQDIIKVFLWGELSRKPVVYEGDLIIINGARVSSFGGKCLNCSIDHCSVLLNPDVESINDLGKFVDKRKSKTK